MTDYFNTLLFTVYPYVALAIMIIGSILRYDREPYSWRSGSSQLLRRRQLVWGSVLFHAGVLFLFFGHFIGLLTPHAVYEPFITAKDKQMLAIVAGSIAGFICLIGLTMLIHRRFFDPRIRATSIFADNAILIILWIQLVLGLVTVPYSLQHTDGTVMLALSEWAQRVLTLRIDGTAELVAAQSWPYQAHILLGLTIFLILPFSRLVHMFSAPIRYIWRPGYQVVRERNRRTSRQLPAE